MRSGSSWTGSTRTTGLSRRSAPASCNPCGWYRVEREPDEWVEEVDLRIADDDVGVPAIASAIEAHLVGGDMDGRAVQLGKRDVLDTLSGHSKARQLPRRCPEGERERVAPIARNVRCEGCQRVRVLLRGIGQDDDTKQLAAAGGVPGAIKVDPQPITAPDALRHSARDFPAPGEGRHDGAHAWCVRPGRGGDVDCHRVARPR